MRGEIKLKVSGDREIIANRVSAEEIILGIGETNKIEVLNLKILFEF